MPKRPRPRSPTPRCRLCPPVASPGVTTSASSASFSTSATVAPAAPVAPALPAIDTLTMDSDYGQFFQPKVPEALKRAAVKKLFTDPHFNIMDGLDTYIDDYSKPDPIPPEMLARLVQARDIIDHPSDRKPEVVEARCRSSRWKRRRISRRSLPQNLWKARLRWKRGPATPHPWIP
ncbi:MAG: DUF3306 domain-containing protein [Betaproteobacteria bacterium]|nr:DUF3306 domain-containing protein [Betaproteobacteria bacterium]